jgi:hypothetical protein
MLWAGSETAFLMQSEEQKTTTTVVELEFMKIKTPTASGEAVKNYTEG